VAWRNVRHYIEFERNRAGSQKSWNGFNGWLNSSRDMGQVAPT